jgi:hypothetical protein
MKVSRFKTSPPVITAREQNDNYMLDFGWKLRGDSLGALANKRKDGPKKDRNCTLLQPRAVSKRKVRPTQPFSYTVTKSTREVSKSPAIRKAQHLDSQEIQREAPQVKLTSSAAFRHIGTPFNSRNAHTKIHRSFAISKQPTATGSRKDHTDIATNIRLKNSTTISQTPIAASEPSPTKVNVPTQTTKVFSNSPIGKEQATNDDLYCYCNEPSYGKMIQCNGLDCIGDWFHLPCLGLETHPENSKLQRIIPCHLNYPIFPLNQSFKIIPNKIYFRQMVLHRLCTPKAASEIHY